ncbi:MULTISPECIES: MFS transporter [Bacillus]|uniref:MFS transporter n=1 Tax=Bacillus TaxID=1386 RepID=UPI00032DEF8C|nr:MFS transporter [Bacillus wiedmannii]EOP14925.1 macrolide-efflux protein [Bacillus cereus BAG2O-3]EOQ07688.1 macrolide-efflux protein [Bacillus cereus B5-2]EOQ21864.1 macrolide-efflux protein [Bacillus cereus BAG3O-1]MBJ8118932.1 MFS transporter [Bacillus cereus]PFW54623.1 MFS transporter [Bacillus sp. AFS075960]RFB09166.1 MFS transporter [Bacillus sp. OE]RFB20564.1 MFS transporter [Bacillus sp. LB(2018)]RFB41887.1 MFS transporter [Bacillus sp. dmp10]RFB69049.1 MFS transporter [Bacillus
MEELQQNKSALEGRGKPLLKNTNFLFLWAATLFSSFALAFFTFSQTWYIAKTLNLEASLGVVFVALSVPRLIFMIIGGAVADKFPKKNIMFYSNIIRAILVATILTWFIVGDVTLYTFALFALFFGLADAFFWSADGSILPELVEKSRLTQANSLTQMTNQASVILGPVLGGILIKFTNYETIFSITILLLIVAAILVQKIQFTMPEQQNTDKGMFTSIKEGILYVKESPFLSTFLLCSAFLNLFLIGPMQVGFPLFIKNVLHGDSLQFSYLEASVGGGMAIGAVIVGLKNINRRRGLFCIIMMLLSGVFFLSINFSTVLWQALLAGMFYGITIAMAIVPLMAMIQSTVKEEMMGRVMSLLMLSSMGFIPLSYAFTSIALAIGIPIVTVMKSGAIAVIVFVLFVAIRVPVVRKFD